jgi:glycosyltransferase involved in cell wall biosynthesis
LVVYRRAEALDAIDAYSRRLVDALVAGGQPATYVPDGLTAVRDRGDTPAWILLQYMPFSYGRWGFAPDLIRDALELKRTTSAAFGVMVHEAWVPMDSWRNCVMGVYQRAQLWSLLALADAVTVSTEYLARLLGGRAVHVPVGSNITPVAATREAARSDLGLRDELVVALFGTGHPHRALDHVEAAIAALAADRGAAAIRVLNLGAGAGGLRVPDGVQVDTPGELSGAEVSVRLQASDLLLVTFTDGVSTRRGTLMAGLAHGVPVVGLRGISTDEVLLRHPDALVLTAVGDREAFVRAVRELAGDRKRMAATGQAGKTLYADQFDWPVVASRVIAAMAGASGARGGPA